ncbi:hypothetical protein BH20GEM2_BH20GEM2_11270 [soil metagenome]
MRHREEVFRALERSAFRRRFRLRARELAYLRSRGMETVLLHAADFVRERIAPAEPVNDGRQTPFGKHPAFLAQHATATCCRRCLEKWHHIPRGRPLRPDEQRYVVEVLGRWLRDAAGALDLPLRPA